MSSEDKKIKKPVRLAKGSSQLKRRLSGKSFVIPSLITMIAIFCGFLAIISAIKGDFVYSVRCVLVAMILDGLDGRVARRLNATSEFGREFDSLSDVVSFGVAPAVLIYSWAFSTVADEFGILVSFIFVVCAATRLARFNVVAASEDTTGGFCGLPSPGAAAAVVCLVYLFPEPVIDPFAVSLVMAFSVANALLMVSTFPYISVKKLKFDSTFGRIGVVALAFVVALVWKYPAVTLFAIFAGYAASGPLLWFVKKKPIASSLVSKGSDEQEADRA